jgi:DNA polymerase-1
MYSETWLGRRRYLPGITSDNWGQKSFAERCSLNTPIQGTAADILKLAITRILAGLPEREWLKPILQIHDELTFIIPEDRLSEAVAFIRACMEEKPFPEFDLPLIAEASAGPTFGMMEELED